MMVWWHSGGEMDEWALRSVDCRLVLIAVRRLFLVALSRQGLSLSSVEPHS